MSDQSVNISSLKEKFRIGLFDEALEGIAKLPDSQIVYGKILKAEILEKRGDMVQASIVIEEATPLIGKDDNVTKFLHEVIRSCIYYKLGNYTETNSSLQSASQLYLKLSKITERDLTEVIANFRRIQGNFFFTQGLFEDAMNAYHTALLLFQQLELAADESMIFHDMGQIQGFMGLNKTALMYYESAYLIQERLNHRTNLAIVLHKIIETNLQLNEMENAEKLLDRLRSISTNPDDDFVTLLYNYSQAIYFKHDNRLGIKFQSQKIFKTIIDSAIVDYSLTMKAMLQYSELLLVELRMMSTNDVAHQEIISDLIDISKKISEVAYNLNSIPLIIKLLILQAHFSVINGDINAARDILDQATQTAKEKQLWFLMERIDIDRRQINSDIQHRGHLEPFNSKVLDELKILEIASYLEDVKNFMDRREEDN